MDGDQVTTRVKRRLRAVGALLATAVALGAVAFVGTGAAQAADGAATSVRYAVGSPDMAAAQQIAKDHWGTDPCGGQVDIQWASLDATTNATSYWANPTSAYDNPDLNTQCRIVFNTAMTFDWPKFCTVVVHEYGHLSGQQHSADGPNVMSPIYHVPLPQCASTPEPEAGPAATPAPAAATSVRLATPEGQTSAADRRHAKAHAKAAKAKERAKSKSAHATRT